MSALPKFASTLLKASTVLGGGAFVFSNCVYTVEPGQRGLIFDRFSGVKDKVNGEGAHFYVPVLQRPIIMDVKTQPRVISTVTGTMDMQRVSISLRVLSRPRTEALPQLYKELNFDYRDRILPPIGNEVLKSVVAQYNADQLLTLRDKVSKEIREALTLRCSKYNLVLDDISLTHIAFSREFAKSIEQKQVAEQMAERQKFVVAQSEQEKLAAIIRAEGDADAAQLVSDSVRKHGKGLIELTRLQAAQKIAESLSKNPNITYLPGSSHNMLLNLPASGVVRSQSAQSR